MSTRKFELGYSKIQTKRIIKTLIASQKGAMNKYIKNIRKMNKIQVG